MARIHTGILLLATVAAAAPAAAATGATSLSVSATVLPTCQVSTEPRSTGASVTCSHLGGGSVAIRRAGRDSGAGKASAADPFEARDAARGDGVSYVTITY